MPITKKQFIQKLNQDLAMEYQAVVQYVIYPAKLTHPQYDAIAQELKVHATEELQHAQLIAKQIDYLGGDPVAKMPPAPTSNNPKKMLKFDLDAENRTIKNYTERIREAEELSEFATSQVLRQILVQEQEHKMDLESALGM